MNLAHLILGPVLVLFSLMVILLKKPVYSALSFLGALITLSAYYLELNAEFIATMQILVYAGAILVVFMFVIILFQDAYKKIYEREANSSKPLIIVAGVGFIGAILLLGYQLNGIAASNTNLPIGFGSVHGLGKALYVDFFFPFEAVVIIFLIAAVGSLYIGKKEI